jgi:hypothetical protein
MRAMAVQNRASPETGSGAGADVVPSSRRGATVASRCSFRQRRGKPVGRAHARSGRMAPDSQTPSVSSAAVLRRREFLENAVDASALGSRDALPTGGVECVPESAPQITRGTLRRSNGRISTEFAPEMGRIRFRLPGFANGTLILPCQWRGSPGSAFFPLCL